MFDPRRDAKDGHFPDVSTQQSHMPRVCVHSPTATNTHTRTHTYTLFSCSLAVQVTETSTQRWMTVWLRHLKPVTSEWMFIWILLPAVSCTGGNSLELQQQECKYYWESHWDMKCSFNYNIDISRSTPPDSTHVKRTWPFLFWPMISCLIWCTHSLNKCIYCIIYDTICLYKSKIYG